MITNDETSQARHGRHAEHNASSQNSVEKTSGYVVFSDECGIGPTTWSEHCLEQMGQITFQAMRDFIVTRRDASARIKENHTKSKTNFHWSKQGRHRTEKESTSTVLPSNTWRKYGIASPAVWTRPLRTRCPWRPPSRCGFLQSHPQASPFPQVYASQEHREAR